METFASSDVAALLTLFKPETHFVCGFNLRGGVIFIALFQFFFNCDRLIQALSPFVPPYTFSYLDWNGIASSSAVGIHLMEFAVNILLFIAICTKCRQVYDVVLIDGLLAILTILKTFAEIDAVAFLHCLGIWTIVLLRKETVCQCGVYH
ncbi:hypothetical protein HA402_000929 [Bradysia odoriphaga]|nr:hypothetical protein HA402_000929 [Bradysia odoriphaga]